MATRPQPLNFGVGVYSLSLSLKETKIKVLWHSIYKALLKIQQILLLLLLVVFLSVSLLLFLLYHICKCFLCSLRQEAWLFWQTFRGFLSASSGRKSEIKMCLPTSREVTSSLLRASLFVDTLYKQEWFWGELCECLLCHTSFVLYFFCIDLVRVSHEQHFRDGAVSQMFFVLYFVCRFSFLPIFLLLINQCCVENLICLLIVAFIIELQH